MGERRILTGLAAGAISAAVFGVAYADSAPMGDPFSKFSTMDAVVLAVRSDFAPVGGHVRLTVYDGPSKFLEAAAGKHEAVVDDDGLALITLKDLKPGEYAFVAYFDENDDGKLNRNPLGKPKEPYVFSNDVKPKLRKPTFDETKVAVAPGEVVVMTLEN